MRKREFGRLNRRPLVNVWPMDTNALLQYENIGKIAVGIIIGLFVVGALLSLIVTKIVGRIIILIVVLVLAGWVWQQRGEIQDKVKKCQLTATFFGQDVKAPQNAIDACKAKLHA